MHQARFVTLAVVAGFALVAACGDDDSTTDVVDLDGSAGASGGGGAGGSGGGDGGGQGGSAGKAGSSGTAGSAGNGGSAGMAGAGGTGGNAGAGGKAGAGGTAGSAGNAGTGGGAGTSVDSGGGGTAGMDASSDGAADVRSDAIGDAPTGDGGACSTGPAAGDDCSDYCGKWFSVCQPIAMWATTYANQAACLAACSTWPDAKLCCRAEHVQLAEDGNNMNQMSMHCGHAVGANNPPPACAN
jgi:hypothetical protein